ncbi:MAG: hypothetical protein JXN10_08100 [Clostridia bacterium]|nr:hypothetical protein [Clostridia bacterium]
MTHTPHGYRIEGGKAVIDETAAGQIKELFEGYNSGLALTVAAGKAGLKMYHSSAKRLLQNERYVGDDYYPAIVDGDVFNKANNEIRRRAQALGRVKEYREPQSTAPQTQFKMGRQTKFFDDPFAQAEYMYSLIESEVD